MASFKITAVDGTYTRTLNTGKFHQISVKPELGTMSGTLTVTAKAPGSAVFEDIPDGTIDLSATQTVIFSGAIEEYQFVLSGFSGSATTLIITDFLGLN